MSERYLGGIITATYNPLLIPNPPTIGTATAGDASASVTFTAPTNVGGGAITSYVAVSSPGGFTGSAASSPVTVSGLTNGTAYTFQVYAVNAYGPSEYSAASNSVTPVAPVYIEDVFSTYLYTGNSSSQTITNGIDLSTNGGLLWIKGRNYAGTAQFFQDTARGANNFLDSTSAGANQNIPTANFSFLTTGFSQNNNFASLNESTYNYCSWTFREQPKFFDIVTYSGDSVDNRQISHNLGSTPGCVIVRRLSGDDWFVYHRSLAANYGLRLNKIDSESSNTSTVKSVSSTTFTVGTDGMVNVSGSNYVAYLFAHDAGGFGLTGSDNVITCGSLTTDGSGDATVTLGYEPQWLLLKQSSTTGNWLMVDTMRGWNVNLTGNIQRLFANLTNAESAGGQLNPTATGFKTSSGGLAASTTYIYIAIRRGPMKTPTVGTSVYTPVSTSGNVTEITAGFPVDLALGKEVKNSTGYGNYAIDRLRGGAVLLETNTAGAEYTSQTFKFDSNTKFLQSGGTFYGPSIYWLMRRAPGFFDEICYTGNGSFAMRNHNLTVPPELVITKARNANVVWYVVRPNPVSKYLILNQTDAESPINFPVTSTTTGVTGDTVSETYVYYLFASVAGVSKVGSYTGTGALQTVNCGFTTGARFVLIKRTDSTGDWYVYDSARGISSGNDPYLLLNSAAAEVTGTNYVDTTSVGFQVTAAAPAGINASGGSYLFLAIA